MCKSGAYRSETAAKHQVVFTHPPCRRLSPPLSDGRLTSQLQRGAPRFRAKPYSDKLATKMCENGCNGHRSAQPLRHYTAARKPLSGA
jgi:hypothetical protein